MKRNVIIGIGLFVIILISSTLGMKAFNKAKATQVEQTYQASTFYSLTAYVDWYAVTPEDMDKNGYFKFKFAGSYDTNLIELLESTYCQTRPSFSGDIKAENGILYLYTTYGSVKKGDYFILYSGYTPIASISIN